MIQEALVIRAWHPDFNQNYKKNLNKKNETDVSFSPLLDVWDFRFPWTIDYKVLKKLLTSEV